VGMRDRSCAFHGRWTDRRVPPSLGRDWSRVGGGGEGEGGSPRHTESMQPAAGFPSPLLCCRARSGMGLQDNNCEGYKEREHIKSRGEPRRTISSQHRGRAMSQITERARGEPGQLLSFATEGSHRWLKTIGVVFTTRIPKRFTSVFRGRLSEGTTHTHTHRRGG